MTLKGSDDPRNVMRPFQGRGNFRMVIRGRRFALPPAITLDAFGILPKHHPRAAKFSG